MNFNSIIELNDENIILMYNNAAEIGSDMHVAACCCTDGYVTAGNYYADACISWCRMKGYMCLGYSWASQASYSNCSHAC